MYTPVSAMQVAAASSAPPPPAAPTATELVTRPEAGIARGKWEAPAWAFWAMLGVILVFSGGYVLRRMGFFARAKPKDSNVPPPSRGSRR
ncbi:MAG: hypothetical protein KIT84_35345 [Labilithrix sp.]|nr:hypothetical protein [Labilithrix sp.]MCW5816327.1 hypothetical protein [Labilithrix sp.]